MATSSTSRPAMVANPKRTRLSTRVIDLTQASSTAPERAAAPVAASSR